LSPINGFWCSFCLRGGDQSNQWASRAGVAKVVMVDTESLSGLYGNLIVLNVSLITDFHCYAPAIPERA